jgi:23S rRNA (uracil1939-C5)-methyltransferase
LKTLVVRESKATGELLAMLYAKKEDIPKFAVDDIAHLAGFLVFHSTEKSPASVPTKELWRWGESMLTERVGGLELGYSWDAFFQNNIPVFETALELIRKHTPEHARVIELFSGVGSIGLSLAKDAEAVHGVEIIENAAAFAKKNALRNGIDNYVSECIPAEKMDGRLLDKKDVLVLDPPRSGLHPKTITLILEKLPPKIIYLSCNPETQARDYSALAAFYSIEVLTGFDFYPQTPHLESLLVLSLKTK